MKSAICLTVRNEERDIAEWMAFHRLVGFDTQIIFDNCSDDFTGDLIKAAAELFDVRYHRWTDRTAESQNKSYEAAYGAYKHEFDWILFLDSDEFLILCADEHVNTFLGRFDQWSGIAVNWAIFGSNGHKNFPSGLVLEEFTRRADSGFFPSRHVKSIIRPGFASRCLNPHCFDLRGNRAGSYCDTAGQPVNWWPLPDNGGIVPGLMRDEPNYDICRVHHYFTRSYAHWLAKLKRGYPSDVAIRKLNEFAEYDRNEILDTTALRFAPAVRDLTARIRARRRDLLQNNTRPRLFPHDTRGSDPATVLRAPAHSSIINTFQRVGATPPLQVSARPTDRRRLESGHPVVESVGSGSALAKQEFEVIFDLTETYEIQEIRIFKDTELTESWHDLSVWTSVKEAEWRHVFTKTGNEDVRRMPTNPLCIEFYIAPLARYIRLRFAGHVRVKCDQIEFYGVAPL